MGGRYQPSAIPAPGNQPSNPAKSLILATLSPGIGRPTRKSVDRCPRRWVLSALGACLATPGFALSSVDRSARAGRPTVAKSRRSLQVSSDGRSSCGIGRPTRKSVDRYPRRSVDRPGNRSTDRRSGSLISGALPVLPGIGRPTRRSGRPIPAKARTLYWFRPSALACCPGVGRPPTLAGRPTAADRPAALAAQVLFGAPGLPRWSPPPSLTS